MVSFKFLNRHYPPSVVLKALSKAQQVPRACALQKLPNSTDDRHRAIFTFHPHNLPIKSIILQKWSILKDDADFGRIFSSPPMIAFRKATSIRDHLVKSRLRPSDLLRGYHRELYLATILVVVLVPIWIRTLRYLALVVASLLGVLSLVIKRMLFM